jgi:tripartite-type tricarboxylate transporter receptor subunit TctC
MQKISAMIAVAAVQLVACVWQASAQNYPSRPIRVIVPFEASGAMDVVMRIVGKKVSDSGAAQIVIENKTGAGGVIGTDSVAKAAPDGTTLLGTYAQHYTNQLVQKTPYDAVSDFEPIARIANSALVISVATSSPYKSLKDVIEAAKKQPGVVTYGSSGNGTTSHMASALFSSMAGVQLNHVPYKAPGQVALDAAAGQIDLSFNGMSSVLPLIKGGRLRALAVTTAQRSQSLPDVPTVAELGHPGYEAASPIWIFAPRGTPQPIIDKLSEAVVRQAQSQAFADLCASLGLEVDVQTAAVAKAAGPAELDKWRRLMKATGAKAE